MASPLANQIRQSATVMMVAGTVVAQYIHSLSDTIQVLSWSLKPKNVVLKIACA